MKKHLIALLAALLFLNGCGTSKDKLYVYNWAYYIPEEVVRNFEKENKVKVVYDIFASNEEMFTKLKAGGSGYDIIFPSGDHVSLMAREGMLEELDKTKLSNFKYLDKTLLKKINFDPDNRFSVPYAIGAAGIAVNKTYVKYYPRNMHIYELSELKGRMTQLDEMREVIGNALKTLGYSVNSTDQKELQQAKELALKWKKNIVKYDSESFAKGFAAGDFWVVQCYAENIFLELPEEQRDNVDFFIPNTGGTMYMDNMVIMKNSKHKDLAYKFLNYIHEPKVYAQIADFLRIPCVNQESRKYLQLTPNYTVADMKKCEMMNDIGPAIEKYNKLWQEIRLE